MPRLPRNPPLLVAGLLVLTATLAASAGTLSADFVAWDDGITIYRNQALGDLSLDRVAWAFTDVATTMRWIPLTLLSLVLTHTFHGLDPFGYHLANWLLHGASASLVFLLLRELLGRSAGPRDDATGLRGPALDDRWVLLSAAAGALAWSLHPLRVEVEAWSNSRGHAQAGLFAILALLVYLRGHRAGAAPRPWRVAALSAGCYLAALMSHPIAIGAAPAFVLLDLHLGRLGGRAGWWSPGARRVLLEKLPFAAATLGVLAVTLLVRTLSPGLWPAPVPLSTWGLLPRALQATFAWIQYALVTVWPVGLQPAPTDLIDFDPWAFQFLFRAALVAALTAAAFLLRRRWPPALLLWLAWLSLCFPALGLTEHPMFACDRYTYLPGLVPAAAVGAAVLWLGRVPARRAATATAAALLLAVLGGLSVAQARVWSDSVALFEHMIPLIGDHPYRANILLFLGYAKQERKRWAESEAAYLQVVALQPNDPSVRSLLAEVLAAQGRVREGLPHLEVAVRFDPASAPLRCRLAGALIASGRPEEAQDAARAAFALDPRNPCALRILERFQHPR